MGKCKKLSSALLLFVTLLATVGLFLIISYSSFAQGLTPEEIMKKVDDNQHIESARIEAEMIIRDRGREMVKEMIIYMESIDNSSNALSEFTNPRDRGTKYFKLGDELWMYFPDAEDLISISGHMMREGMMGSDFSYEDALESKNLTALYKFELIGEEIIGDRNTYIISGTAREGEEVSYYSRKLWVDQERYVILKEEYFTTGGRLMKVMEIEEVQEFKNNRWFPVIKVMNDKLREGSQTILKINEIDFDYVITKDKISLDTLQ